MWGNWNKATVPKNNLITEESACEASQQEEEHLYGKTLHTVPPSQMATSPPKPSSRGGGMEFFIGGWWGRETSQIADLCKLRSGNEEGNTDPDSAAST